TRDELTDAACGVELATRVLRREPLVLVVVAAEHHVRVVVVQRLPDRPHGGVRCVVGTGGEPRVVPVGEGARLGAGRQVRTQPLLLCRPHVPGDVGVDHDDVPVAEVVRVVALGRVTGGGTEVGVVAGRASCVVFVVAGRGLGACLVPAPGRVVVGVVFREGAAVVGVVGEGVDGTVGGVQRSGGR